LIAAAWMVSAQKGHCLVCGGLYVMVSILVYIGNL
jgi:hypothetical protein